MRAALAEFIGTFFLVFAGTGAIVVNQSSGGVIGHVGIAIVFGLVVFSLIQAFGDVSGAHFNPAVTLAFATAGRFPWSAVGGYALAQFGGALLASGVLRMMFRDAPGLGETLPSGGVGQSFAMEFILTAALMLVILSVSIGAKEKGITAGLAIGSLVGLEAMFAGPVSGASMNPARSLAPAVVSGHLQHLWVYLLATTSGALLAVPLCACLRGKECCRDRP
jgi:aquaporin NIP